MTVLPLNKMGSAQPTQKVLPDSRFEPTDEAIGAALSQSVYNALPTIAITLGVLYALLTAAHMALLPPEQQRILVPVAATSAVVYFICYFIIRAQAIGSQNAHPLAGFFGLVALFNSIVHLMISGDPLQATNLILVILAVGAFYLSASWYFVSLAAALAGFVAAVSTATFDDLWLHFAIAIIMSAITATLINRIRVRTYRRMFRLRLRSEAQQVELEANRRELELRVEERTADLARTNDSLKEEMGRRTVMEIRLKESEQDLLRERESLRETVSQQTEQLRRANEALKETANVKADYVNEIGGKLRPEINEIVSKLDVLKSGIVGGLNERQQALVLNAHERTTGLLDTVRDVQKVSNMGVAELQLMQSQVAVPQMVKTAAGNVGLRARQKGIQTALHVDPMAHIVSADSGRLRHILVNLLNNAIQKAPQNGKAGMMVRGNTVTQMLHFIAWDTGAGLTEEQKQALFADSAEKSGQFWNLNLSRRLAERHGGTLTIEGNATRGTVFVVKLPWAPPTAAERNALSTRPAPGLDQRPPTQVELLIRSLNL